MAEDESILVNPPTPEDAEHVRDYTRFIQLVKWTAILSLAIAFIVMMLIS